MNRASLGERRLLSTVGQGCWEGWRCSQSGAPTPPSEVGGGTSPAGRLTGPQAQGVGLVLQSLFLFSSGRLCVKRRGLICVPPGKRRPRAPLLLECELSGSKVTSRSAPCFPRSLTQDQSDNERWIPSAGQQGCQAPPDDPASSLAEQSVE